MANVIGLGGTVFKSDDLDAALNQVRLGGAEISSVTEDSEFGRFGWFIDPDVNKVELWQPQIT